MFVTEIGYYTMPPKRKAAGSGRGGKKAKTEPTAAQPSTARQMADALKKAGDDRKKTTKVDSYCYQLAGNGQVSFAACGWCIFVLSLKQFEAGTLTRPEHSRSRPSTSQCKGLR